MSPALFALLQTPSPLLLRAVWAACPTIADSLCEWCRRDHLASTLTEERERDLHHRASILTGEGHYE